ncbi:MAG: NAD-binding protein [Myxococcota bacterium]
MKFLSAELMALLSERETRQNLKGLSKYLAFLTATVVAYSVLFHVLMTAEGQDHSWITGVYWTLTVMSTLGFGDITFQSDLGRFFSLVVLLTGIILLLIVLPFVFIRSFYAPWLEAQLRLRAPREVPERLRDHVILCRWDEIAVGLVARLRERSIPYTVIEPDTTRAAELHGDGIHVVAGALDNEDTYDAVKTGEARLLVANLSDPENANILLTAREHYPNALIAAFAEEADSVDILQLSGASAVVPLKQRLGEYLASRVTVGPAHAHLVGRYRDLQIAELPIENTGLAGRTIRDTRLRELTGLNVAACWERGHLVPATPDTVLTEHSVAVVVGSEDELAELDALFVIYHPNDNPVVVIGGGKVGQATARALRRRGVAVSMIERDPDMRSTLSVVADEVTIGDASDRNTIMKAGLAEAPSVVLTTHDDPTNMFLAVYCRRLNPSVRIISRVNHERNLESIHRAGADSVLSYTTLGVKSLLALTLDTDATFVGEGVDLIVEPVPACLVGKRLSEAEIGEKTELNVVALQRAERAESVKADTILEEGAELVMLGSPERRGAFRTVFGKEGTG